MSYTREQWSRAFLSGIGNTSPTQNTLDWVINWTAAEGSTVGGQGDFNLLNTTQPMPGSHGGGSQGNIQYFSNFSSGIQANDKVLENGLYPSLLSALQTNNESALGFGGNPSSGVMHDLSIWCGGCGYGDWFAKQKPSQSWLSQLFPGTPNINIPTSTTTGLSGSVSPNSSGSSLFNLWSFLGLPSQQDMTAFFQQFFIVFFAFLVILIGILVLFFANKEEKV